MPAPPRLRVTAEVVARLGAELITDRYQALLELIKNSYDAEASRVDITIDTTPRYEQEREAYYTWTAVEPQLIDSANRDGAAGNRRADPQVEGDEDEDAPAPLQ